METINTLAIPAVQYSFDVINWILQDLRWHKKKKAANMP